jgi:cytochrome c5
LPIQTKQNSTGLNGALAFFALVARQKNDAIAKALTRAQISRDATILARPQTRDVAANNPRAAFGPAARIHDKTLRGYPARPQARMKHRSIANPEEFSRYSFTNLFREN